MRTFGPFFVLIPILLIDLYVYYSLKRLLPRRNKGLRSSFFWIYWIVSIGLVTGVLIAFNLYESDSSDITLFKRILNYNAIFITAFCFKIVFALFALGSDLVSLVTGLIGKIRRNEITASKAKSISRGDFIKKMGILVSIIPVIGIIHGIGWGRFNFTLHKSKVPIKNLPDDLEGFKIVQLSDAHLGSFAGNEYRLEEVFEQINELEPDIIVFTGDMVNNYSHEMSGWVPVWKKLKARYGKYSVLGNHDYGDYSEWPTEAAKKRNLQDIIRQQKEMGFDVLMNENRLVNVGSETLQLAGVENWGTPPFPQHGNIEKALQGLNPDLPVILLSHDPDHFEQKIRGMQNNVALTLSGHTHGFQFGVEIGNFKISPVQLKYKRWAGLYQENDQYLYVNRGLGYLAFPGRVGIWPEITMIELTK